MSCISVAAIMLNIPDYIPPYSFPSFIIELITSPSLDLVICYIKVLLNICCFSFIGFEPPINHTQHTIISANPAAGKQLSFGSEPLLCGQTNIYYTRTKLDETKLKSLVDIK